MTSEAIILRCLDALEILASAPRGLPMTALTQRLGVVKSGMHRLLAELVAEGYVTQEPESQFYRLTMRLPALGFRYLIGTGIVDVSRAPLDRLATKTGELVRMTIAEPHQLTWIARAQGAQTRLRFDPETGREVRLHTTASARIWLATLPEEQRLPLIKTVRFGDAGEFGPNAPSSAAELNRRIRDAGRDGYAIAIDESEHGMSAVAVTIPNSQDGKPVLGTISVAGPTMRLGHTRLTDLVSGLRATAADLSTTWPAQARDFSVVEPARTRRSARRIKHRVST